MFTEKSLFGAINEYHKFDIMQHTQHNKQFAITVVNNKKCLSSTRTNLDQENEQTIEHKAKTCSETNRSDNQLTITDVAVNILNKNSVQLKRQQ
jgi:hypothetical protein